MKQTRYAFFDVDNTLISIKSMFSFHKFWYCQWRFPDNRDRLVEYQDVTAILKALIQSEASRELINQRYYEFFAGRSVEEVSECAQAWFNYVQKQPDLFLHEPLKELLRLRKIGYIPVLVSGSFHEIISHIAIKLNINFVLATQLAIDNNKYTGKILHQMIGSGKATAIQNFLVEKAVPTDQCQAFGDDISDLPMLEIMGESTVIEGDPRLEFIAKEREWRIIRLNSAYGQQ
jgi:HAD superfamily hydrolase (TIGR01490 family)